MTNIGQAEYAASPIIQFSDSSFQDCPDTARSTGGYLTFMQGGVIEAVSTMPNIISQSTCEAEYCTASITVMSGCYIRKIFNELLGYDSDRPLSIPLGIDSQSAMDTAQSERETNRTRHIARRFHYVRHATHTGSTVLFKVEGTKNPSNSMTKVLTAESLDNEARLYQVNVNP
jgi:hypothetical protein